MTISFSMNPLESPSPLTASPRRYQRCPTFAKIPAAHTLNERKIESVFSYAIGDKCVHQHAVNRSGSAVFVVVFGGIGIDTFRQGLEMLAHRVGDLLLQVVVRGMNFGADDSGLVQVLNTTSLSTTSCVPSAP